MTHSESSLLFSNADILSCIDSILGERNSVQAMFNQGKIVYQTGIVARDEQHLYLDVDGIEETSLISMIDFYSSVIFVFYSGGFRHQFLSKNSLLTTLDGITVLKIPIPASINRIPSRKSNRFVIPDGFAFITMKTPDGEAKLPVRELSLGGLSIWSDSSYSMTAHSIIRNATLSFHDGASLVCSLEISRVNYVADGPGGMTHVISTQFIYLNEKQETILSRKIQQYNLTAEND